MGVVATGMLKNALVLPLTLALKMADYLSTDDRVKVPLVRLLGELVHSVHVPE